MGLNYMLKDSKSSVAFGAISNSWSPISAATFLSLELYCGFFYEASTFLKYNLKLHILG